MSSITAETLTPNDEGLPNKLTGFMMGAAPVSKIYGIIGGPRLQLLNQIGGAAHHHLKRAALALALVAAVVSGFS